MATKKLLLGYLLKQEEIFTRLEEKATKLKLGQNTAENCINKLEEGIARSTNQMEKLYRQVQDDAHRRESLSSQAALVRDSISRLELEHNTLAKNFSASKKQRDEIFIDEDKMSEVLDELKSKIAVGKNSESLAELKQTSDSLDKIQESMQLALTRHEGIRVEYEFREGDVHTPPKLDMNHF